MPITPAHAAAAWPLHAASKRLPLAALVIGTFSPDLEYVLRLRPVGKFGHSPMGLVVFCVPVTLLLFWIWRAVVRPTLVPLLPAGLRAAAEAPPPGRRTDLFPLAIVAALLGAASHVFWDGFTHWNGWGVTLLPALAAPSPYYRLSWFAVAQYVSSVLGVIVIGAWIAITLLRYPRAARAFAPGEWGRLIRAVLFISAVSLGIGAANASLGDDWVVALGRAAVGSELGLALGLVAYALYARSPRGLRARERRSS